MSQLLKPSSHHLDFDGSNSIPSTPGKFKLEKSTPFSFFHRNVRSQSSFYKLAFWSTIIVGSILFFFLRPSQPSPSFSLSTVAHSSYGGHSWEKLVRASTRPKRSGALTVLVTGAAGFVGSHVSAALRRRGDGVLGLDNFNDYYDPSLKRARQLQLQKSVGLYIVEGDINDAGLLSKLFDVIPFTHVLHLAAQAGVRYALENPKSYVQSNVAGLVNLFEACRIVNPQPSIVWASSSSVYGLNTKVPFSELDRTDQPASLYAATKKAGEEIAHTYNHIHGLSITGLRFFTVYGPWGRPDMAYFFFTRDILKGKSIPIFEGPDHTAVARDFTYIDDIVKGCIGSLDTAEKSTGSGGKKKGPAQLRIFNLGNTSPVPVSQLVTILERLLKVKAKRKVMNLPRNGDVQFTHANITLAQEELGYKPTTDLQTGLKKFVKWYLDYYGSSGRKGGGDSLRF